MIDLYKYINESIFDDEDTHMDNLDKVADIAYIKKLLKKDDFDDFEKSIDEVENMIKKNHVKIPASKIDYGNKYIEFNKGKQMNKYLSITIYSPSITNVKKLDILKISFSDTNRFRVFCGRTKSEVRSNAIGQFYRTIYELPKEYEWMIEWFKEEFKKKKK